MAAIVTVFGLPSKEASPGTVGTSFGLRQWRLLTASQAGRKAQRHRLVRLEVIRRKINDTEARCIPVALPDEAVSQGRV